MGAWARAGRRVWDFGNGSLMLRKAIWEKNFPKETKILRLSQKYSKTNLAKLLRNL